MTEYYCTYCDFRTTIKGNYESHLRTLKHYNKKKEITLSLQSLEMPDDIREETKDDRVNKETTESKTESKKESKKEIYKCEICEKEYKSRGGLWKHNQLCYISESETEAETEVETEKEVDIVSKLGSPRIRYIDPMDPNLVYLDDSLIQLIGIGAWALFAFWWLKYTYY